MPTRRELPARRALSSLRWGGSIDYAWWCSFLRFSNSLGVNTLGFESRGQQEAWIATIPEPAPGLLVIAGVLGLAVARRTKA
jgi:hypothetical protein